MTTALLQEARVKMEYLLDYYNRRENGYHPECEPVAVSEAAAMLPALITEVEKCRAMAIDERCKVIMLLEKLKDAANNSDWQTRGLSKTYDEYMEQAESELTAESLSWRKIGPDEEKAITWAIDLMGDCETASVLRKLLEDI